MKRPAMTRRDKSMNPAALARLDDMMGRMEREQASIREAFEMEIARRRAWADKIKQDEEPQPADACPNTDACTVPP